MFRCCLIIRLILIVESLVKHKNLIYENTLFKPYPLMTKINYNQPFKLQRRHIPEFVKKVVKWKYPRQKVFYKRHLYENAENSGGNWQLVNGEWKLVEPTNDWPQQNDGFNHQLQEQWPQMEANLQEQGNGGGNWELINNEWKLVEPTDERHQEHNVFNHQIQEQWPQMEANPQSQDNGGGNWELIDNEWKLVGPTDERHQQHDTFNHQIQEQWPQMEANPQSHDNGGGNWELINNEWKLVGPTNEIHQQHGAVNHQIELLEPHPQPEVNEGKWEMINNEWVWFTPAQKTQHNGFNNQVNLEFHQKENQQNIGLPPVPVKNPVNFSAMKNKINSFIGGSNNAGAMNPIVSQNRKPNMKPPGNTDDFKEEFAEGKDDADTVESQVQKAVKAVKKKLQSNTNIERISKTLLFIGILVNVLLTKVF